MEQRKYLHYLRSVVLIDLVIFGAAALLCLAVGWRTSAQYGQLLAGIGMILILGGVSQTMRGPSSLGAGGRYAETYVLSRAQKNKTEYIKGLIMPADMPLGCATVTLLCGIAPVLVGVVLLTAS